MTIITTEEHKVRNEDGYIVNLAQSIPADGNLVLHIENPPNDGRRAVITEISVSSPDGKVIVEQPYGFTIDSIGTEHPIENRARGSSNTSAMNAYGGTTYSNADHVDTFYLGTGTGGAGTVGGAISEDISNTLLSDTDMILNVQNASSSNARDVSITVTFYETVEG